MINAGPFLFGMIGNYYRSFCSEVGRPKFEVSMDKLGY